MSLNDPQWGNRGNDDGGGKRPNQGPPDLEHALATRLEFVEVGGGVGDPPLDFGNAAVADLGGAAEIGLPLDLGALVLEVLLQGADGVDRLLLVLPMLLHRVDLGVELGKLVDQRLEPVD